MQLLQQVVAFGIVAVAIVVPLWVATSIRSKEMTKTTALTTRIPTTTDIASIPSASISKSNSVSDQDNITPPDACSHLSSATTSTTSLELARQLKAPVATVTVGGEMESEDFWHMHDGLLKEAWKEWAISMSTPTTTTTEMTTTTTTNSNLPKLDEEKLIDPLLLQMIHDVWKSPTIQGENNIRSLFTEIIPNEVYLCQLFNPNYISLLRRHIDAASIDSNIPTRRPNGRNRHGIILDKETDGGVSYPEIDNFRNYVINTYVRQFGRLLFGEYISNNEGNNNDDSESYAFTIRYKESEDIELKEHSDASLITMNINLNLPNERYDGSSLYFVTNNNNDENNNKETTFETSSSNTTVTDNDRYEVKLLPGQALIHRGLIRHAAMPITNGERLNLVLWLFGKDGYVRSVPYEEDKRLGLEERWTKV